jgi:aminoglycoside phosphotransferase (APT) family kinase protein
MVESTHDVTLGDGTVLKRYRSWENGEPEREWSALTLLHRTVPGVAPEPLEQRFDDGVPAIVMSRVPGEPLGTAPLNRQQLRALGHVLRRMYAGVPIDLLEGLGERNWGPTEMVSTLRSWIGEPHSSVSPTVQGALDAAGIWLGSTEVTSLTGPLVERVFTQADGNLGNFIWDGYGCSVVDFEDSGVSDPAFEVADLVEHVTVWLPGLLEVGDLVDALGFSQEQRRRLHGFRRLMSVFWLLMLLPGNPGHDRNPPGSVERQASRVLDLLEAPRLPGL